MARVGPYRLIWRIQVDSFSEPEHRTRRTIHGQPIRVWKDYRFLWEVRGVHQFALYSDLMGDKAVKDMLAWWKTHPRYKWKWAEGWNEERFWAAVKFAAYWDRAGHRHKEVEAYIVADEVECVTVEAKKEFEKLTGWTLV